MKQIFLILGISIGILVFGGSIEAQTRVEYKLPDIPGFVTLKGDFHIHTFYSDGSVAPEDRVKEAWRDGLDVIAITDHIEYPNNQFSPIDLNKSYDLAIKTANEYGILLIKGGEITRSMPPGHFNVLFVQDLNRLRKEKLEDVYQEVKRQQGFMIWNHPGWSAQITDSMKWYPKHTELYDQNLLNGIEIHNEREYYPQVFQWALDKSLTIFANSDIHAPIDFLFDPAKKEHRAMTIVLAKDRSIEGLKDAFINHRTLAIFDEKIYGSEQYVKPFLENCIVVSENITIPGRTDEIYISLTNISDFPIHLLGLSNDQFQLPKTIDLLPNTTVRVKVSQIKSMQKGINRLQLPFKVLNGFMTPDQNVVITISVEFRNWGVVKIQKHTTNKWEVIPPILSPELNYWYSVDETAPGYTTLLPFQYADSIHFKMSAIHKNKPFGQIYEADYFLHQGMNQKIVLKNEPHQKYYGNGAETLLDGIKGTNAFTDGKWVGFKGNDLDAVITFDSLTDISNVSISFLENNHSWIFMPTQITIEISYDGIHFKSYYSTTIKPNDTEQNGGIQTIQAQKKGKKVKAIRVYAKNRGVCPEWHNSKGKACWLFVSEIVVR